MIGVVEGEGGGLIDRHGARVRGGVGVVTGVQGTGVEAQRALDVFERHKKEDIELQKMMFEMKVPRLRKRHSFATKTL